MEILRASKIKPLMVQGLAKKEVTITYSAKNRSGTDQR